MSYDPRIAARYGAREEEDGGSKKGSVRAARKALQEKQGQLPDRSKIIGLPQRPNQRLAPAPSRSAAPVSPTPQWPLTNDADDALDSRPGLLQPNRGPPPQRPPRPTSDELPIQQLSPQYRDSFNSDDPFSPLSGPSSRPLTTSSAHSEASSLGEIPDFPVPEPPMPAIQPLPRRIPSLGPPPSSRRGPSSYYTQMSYVSPIAEEAETRSNTIRSHHGSFASSMAMPANEDLYYEDPFVRSDDEETITSDHGRLSPGSDHDDKSGLVTPAIVRQASLGRRTKPSMMTIRSVENSSVKRKPSPPGGEKEWEGGIAGAALAAKDGIGGNGPARLRELSPDDASLDSPTYSDHKFRDPEKDMDPEKDGSMAASAFRLQGSRGASFADRPGRPRPPRLDVDAVREAEARGSLTSLPELIRRATRLAANLDRGKTASRLGLDFWEAGAPEKKHHSNSMGDMLSQFPPPAQGTPLRGGTPDQKRLSKWPSAGEYGPDSTTSDRKGERRRRRCCGMPMWTFVTLLVVLLFLVAAAVIIPIVLVVIPKMKSQASTAAQDTQGTGTATATSNPAQSTGSTGSGSGSSGNQNSQCSGIITCQNGGVAIPNADRSCNCVCINGFTGKTCATQGDSGCTTTSIGSTANNATVGSGIPRLIESAQSDFQIPLDSTRLLTLFSGLSMSCTAENALITFNGLASRSVSSYIPILIETSTTPSRSLPLLDQPHPEPAALQHRQAIGNVGSANENGNAASSPSATVSTKSAATTTIPISSNPTALDFARLGVLLSLQVSGKLDTAANAQEAIQNFLSNDRQGGSKSSEVDLDVFTIDLVKFSIKFDNGTTVQASVPTGTSS
ncbi:hypothetical protein DPSP01_012797 [Paraphaeosphaeria sporulosa]|uniref:EGF-like domain-containing protein n=1 Tax=Paraphaeosphaeria sporulosa TaxID=1460663 RepID=A0A177CTS3_9PLEO|nr:uncharacterized protein CC84DRAFT_491653 [Paraphaeosphaeria sporulosa]OAG10676.1 hypothetical protein CC84DRAFT_491653 [Paraphaeosphaeria sporulosa]